MARADVAKASARSDSIKGLAQSIAKRLSASAHRRPALRRAVPAIIIAFLLTIAVGAIVSPRPSPAGDSRGSNDSTPMPSLTDRLDRKRRDERR